jgi:xanthine dehydrogenase YagR molybdenum-binding subunit
MRFDQPATTNPIDQGRVVGRPTPRIDGPLKTTGTAPYAYEHHEVTPTPAVGFVIGAGIAKGRVAAMDLRAARAAPGVLAIVTAQTAGKLGKGSKNTARLLGGPDIEHYHQALAVVVAETFEQARAAAALVNIRYETSRGRFDLSAEKAHAPLAKSDGMGGKGESRHGDFDGAFVKAAVQFDATYTTPDQSHAMMEPHATIAWWEGAKLSVWTSNQMVDWGVGDLAQTLGIPKQNVRLRSPFVGGGFGGKLFLRSDVVLAALAARAAGRPVKVALQRPLIINNTTHRPATIQRIRLGADQDGRLTAIAHQSWSGDLPGGGPETAPAQTRLLYAGEHRYTAMHLAVLDLPEGNAMRAPGEAPGLMALEIAMDEMAEKLGLDPVEFRLRNDTQVDPEKPERPFSQRRLAECLRLGAERFNWSRRAKQPGQMRDGRWLVGLGMAVAFRNNLNMKSRARVRLEADGRVAVETDMTDIGTGSYTILAQTAAETLGVTLDRVIVRLGDSAFPVSCGSGGQWGANNSCAGVYAACMKLRGLIAQRAGLGDDARFADGQVSGRGKTLPLASFAGLVAEDGIEYGDLGKRYQQSTFGSHFCEVAVDPVSGEVKVRRMLAVCAAGRILNPTSARSQVIGAMTMGVGAALMEALHVDKRRGFFVNHDLAGYEVPVHADIPQQEVIFLDETDPISSPMKAKGVGELGICGAAAAVANAVYHATGVRVRDYPVTLDKLLAGLPALA